MMRIVPLLLLILTGASNICAETKEVDIRLRTSDQSTFYLIFASRGIHTDGPAKSPKGHAFIVWRDKPTAGPTPLRDRAFGLHPVNNADFLAPGPGELQADDLSLADHTLSVRVDAEQWAKTETMRASYSKPTTPIYMLNAIDCLKFVIDVGKAINLNMSQRGPLTTPDDFIEKLAREIEDYHDLDFGDGNYYRGQTLVRNPNDVMHIWPYGHRVYISGKGPEIRGRFVYGFVDGPGQIDSPDGDTFTGNFTAGYPSDGTWSYHQGFTYTGPKARPGTHPTVHMGWSNGDYYDGQVDDQGTVDGPGALYEADGDVLFSGVRSHGNYTGDKQVAFPNGDKAVVHVTTPAVNLIGNVNYTRANGEQGTGAWNPQGAKITFPHHHPESHGGDIDHPLPGQLGVQFGGGAMEWRDRNPNTH